MFYAAKVQIILDITKLFGKKSTKKLILFIEIPFLIQCHDGFAVGE